MQTCDKCAEKIKAKAKYCRYCRKITGYGLRLNHKKAIEQRKKDEGNMSTDTKLDIVFGVFYIIVFILMLLFTLA